MKIRWFVFLMCLSTPLLAQEVVTPKVPPLGTVAPQPQPTTSNPELSLEERLLFLLSGYHYFPSKDDLAKLGSADEVSKMLREMAQDTDQRPSLRMKALDALMFYDDPITLAYLEHLVVNDPVAPEELLRTEQLMQHHAIMALAKVRKEASLQTIQTLLNHQDIQIQMTAISAIGKHMGSSGKRVLDEFSKRANSPAVQRELRKYVRF